MGFTRDRASGAGTELAPHDLAARAILPRRILLAGLCVMVAAPFLPAGTLAIWFLLYLATGVAEHLTLGRHGARTTGLLGLCLTFSVSLLTAFVVSILIAKGDGGGRLFAVVLVSMSSVNVLLRFYNAPRHFLAAIAPYLGVMGLTCWSMMQLSLAKGDWLRACAPPAVIVIYALLLVPMRRSLAEAWSRLAEAKKAAEQASQAKSEFLATMSHEIRTPLNGVLGMAQAMQADELSPPQTERLRLIRRSGETLLSILNDVLDLSKIEEGQLALCAEEFDLEHVTRGAVATFTPLAERKGLGFDFSIEPAATGRYVGDSVRLRQVIYNLVSNAVKFTEVGGVGVAVSWRDGWLAVAVADSGPGIAAEKIERLFDKFVQGDASATRRHGGTGLGLTICRQLAELMGGHVSAQSAPGRGSIFTLEIPLPRIADAAPAEAPPAAEAAAERPLRILAAEDNQVNQLVLRTLLSQAGIETTLVENGAEAVEAWVGGAWDLILMDIQMPVMDGVTAAREIRARELAGGRPRTPIIAVTANAMAHQVKDYLAAGMDLVAPKPIDATKLFEAMERVLAEAEAVEERAA